MTRNKFITKAPIEWENIVDTMSDKERLRLQQELERLSERAGMLAGYLEERQGYGYGDRGHANAVKRANKIGKIIHVKAFGYNAFYKLPL